MMDGSGICEYEYWYNDTRTGKYEDYSCNRACVSSSKYCVFHDEYYFQTHEAETRKLFLEELKEFNDGVPIFFIGCNIPAIEIIGLTQNRPIYFVNAKFHGNVEFFDNVFRSVNFTDAKLTGKFQMASVEINEIILFTKVKWLEYKGESEFKLCNFKTADFSLTTFDSISFQNCEFGFAKFRTTTFTKSIMIDNSVFTNKVDFSDVKFFGETGFSNTSFHSNTSFQYSKFPNPVKFYNIDFKEQQLVIFEGNLSNISFIGTDITRIKFEGNTIWGGDDTYTVFDEIELVRNPEKFNLSSVLAVYRNLRENYEFHLMYEEAGQFFVKEMELKRVYFQDSNDSNKTKVKKVRRYFSVTNCYNVLSKYGESFKQVSAWSLTLFFSALTYFFIYPDIIALNETKPLGEIDYSSKLSEDIFFRLEISLERTLGSFFQINEGRLADYVVRIVSLPILGTMFIVLRRRFERRFRH